MSATSPYPHIESLLKDAAWIDRVARALVFDDQQVDDVVQQTLLRMMQQPRAPENTRSWFVTHLRRIARERARSDSRRKARELEQAQGEPISLEEAASDAQARTEWQKKVVQAVLDLEDPYRSTLLLRYVDDQSVQDIATRLGIQPSTVRSRIKRGLDQVRARFDREEKSRPSWSMALASALLASKPTTSTVPVVWGALGCLAVGLLTVVLLKTAISPSSTLPNNEEQAAHAPSNEATILPSASDDERTLVTESSKALSARVVSSQGTPVEGAIVSLVADDIVGVPDFLQEHGRTDATGQFTLRIQKNGKFALRVNKGEAFSIRRKLDLSPDVDRHLGEIVLHRPAAVRGTVFDSHGQPLPKASVVATTDFGGGLVDWRTHTKEDGTFTLRATNVGGECAVYAVDANHAPTVVNVKVGEPLVIRLEPGRTVRGHIFDTDGKPLSDAKVCVDVILHRITNTGFMYPEDTPREVRSAPDGSFELSHVPKGQIALKAIAKGHWVGNGSVDAEGAQNDDVVLRLTSSPERFLEGHVVDEETGHPVEGVVLDGTARTDENGAFRLLERQSFFPNDFRHYHFTVRRSGYVNRTMKVPYPDPGAPYPPLRVELTKASKIRGLVLDSEGRPLAGTSLWFESEDRDVEDPDVYVKTGLDGTFEADLLPGLYRAIQILSSRFPRAYRPSFQIQAHQELERVLVLGGGTSLSGTITDSEGRPVKEAEVRLWRWKDGDARVLCRDRTDEQGRYFLGGLEESTEEGPLTFTVRGKTFAPFWQSVTLDADGSSLDVEVEEGHEVEGQVLDADGHPYPGCWVTATPDRESEVYELFTFFQTNSDEDGLFVIPHLPDVTLTVAARPNQGDREKLEGDQVRLDPPFGHVSLKFRVRESR